MKFSDSKNYLSYIDRTANGDIKGAMQAIKRCLLEFRAPQQYSFLLQVLGNLHFLIGDVENSKKCFSESELADPTSLICKYLYAKFLADKLMEYENAIKKCNEIGSILASERSRQIDDNISDSQYSEMITELRKFCEQALYERGQ